MRILVTGKNGQLGKSINKIVNVSNGKNNYRQYNEFIFVGREELDLSSQSNINQYFNNNDKFDVIFMDPPYKEKGLNKLIIDIIEAKIIKENGIIIIHRHKKEEDEFLKEFRIIEEKTYGISRVLFGICA